MATIIRVVCTVEKGRLTYEYPDPPYGSGRSGHDTDVITAILYEVVFNDIHYGDHFHGAPFGQSLSARDGARKRAEKLAERVQLCRAWMAECDAADAALTGDVTITLADD